MHACTHTSGIYISMACTLQPHMPCKGHGMRGNAYPGCMYVPSGHDKKTQHAHTSEKCSVHATI